jgi:hypothetical protein
MVVERLPPGCGPTFLGTPEELAASGQNPAINHVANYGGIPNPHQQRPDALGQNHHTSSTAVVLPQLTT